MGHSHAIYNPTDKPVQWMNINVSHAKDTYDAFNLNDPRLDVPLDPIPQFINMRLDRALLRPVKAMNGGKGTVQYRRALDPSVFFSRGLTWTIWCCRRGLQSVRTCTMRWRSSIT